METYMYSYSQTNRISPADKKTLLAFRMPDMAVPAFCSFVKVYMGSLSDIAAIIERLRSVPDFEETVSAFDEYLSGNRQAEHSVACARYAILEPAEVVAQKRVHLTEMVWKHINIWGFPYTMRFNEAEVERVAVRYREENLLYCRACFQDLCYETGDRRWVELNGDFWGNKWVLDRSVRPGGHYTVRSLVFIREANYDTEEQLMAALADDSTIRFRETINEIFGDG